MLLYDFVMVPREFPVCAARLTEHRAALSRVAAASTISDGTVEVGPPRPRGDTVVVPIAWSVSPPALFVTLDAELAVAPLEAASTHLSLTGSCRPADGGPGRRRDAVAARRRIEHGVRGFLFTLGALLEQGPDTWGPDTWGPDTWGPDVPVGA